MAKIISHLFSEISGSIGGATYTKSNSGQIRLKTRTSRTSSFTPRHNLINSLFSTASSKYKSLTPYQLSLWRNFYDQMSQYSHNAYHFISPRHCYIAFHNVINYTHNIHGSAVPIFLTSPPSPFSMPAILVSMLKPPSGIGIRITILCSGAFNKSIRGFLYGPYSPVCRSPHRHLIYNQTVIKHYGTGDMAQFDILNLRLGQYYIFHFRVFHTNDRYPFSPEYKAGFNAL
jgi:hypothetical protein